jgi:hypothetical protein
VRLSIVAQWIAALRDSVLSEAPTRPTRRPAEDPRL